ncbi:RHS repeat domain-containing protein [Flavobacterium sp. LM4]|uniref:RHS repeat domain-containing protein n=1 Tax=Flavobacterium sp. LM4 TaxID=1938609 RepID=UPI000993A098|nr:RHS repeat-associated core domain-containing protein [Flavobacterium sp. LM4]OOV17730.1 hypothetical protein BXU10_16880 [Flavobacterium sp. LM4]
MLKTAILRFLNCTEVLLFIGLNRYSDYYPFGMIVPSRHGSSDSYRYGFQGQEKDDEMKGEGNSLNYTFRMHDPRIGRFFAVDPLTKEYPYYTPYSFSGNKVIAFTELEGLEENSMHPAGPLDNVEASWREISGGRISDLSLDRDDAKSGEEKSKIAKEQKKVLVKTAKATEVVKKATYATAGIAASPFMIGGAFYIAPAYESYTVWYGSSQAYAYFSGGLTSAAAADFLSYNGLSKAGYSFVSGSLAQYAGSGFKMKKVDFLKNAFTSLVGGYGSLAFSSSFQKDPESGEYHISSMNEFTLDFTFGRINDKIGDNIKGLNIPKTSGTPFGMGLITETFLKMDAKIMTNVIKNKIKDEFITDKKKEKKTGKKR